MHTIKLLVLTLAFDSGYLSQYMGLTRVPPCVLQSVQLDGAPNIYSDRIPPYEMSNADVSNAHCLMLSGLQTISKVSGSAHLA